VLYRYALFDTRKFQLLENGGHSLAHPRCELAPGGTCGAPQHGCTQFQAVGDSLFSGTARGGGEQKINQQRYARWDGHSELDIQQSTRREFTHLDGSELGERIADDQGHRAGDWLQLAGGGEKHKAKRKHGNGDHPPHWIVHHCIGDEENEANSDRNDEREGDA
jgi:hypothetical protein